jgi:ribose transport system substrate-binding protein
VLMHTLQLDWSTLQLNGIKQTLAKYGATMVGPGVADWDPKKQAANIQDMIQQKPDAIIAVSVDTSATGPAFKTIQKAGIPLILIIQAPVGTQHKVDYVTQVANEAVREGATSGAMLSSYVKKGGTVLCSCFGTPFWSVDERERGFKLWFKTNRPDVQVEEVDWLDAAKAGQVTLDYLTAHPNIDGIFTPWDAPGMQVVASMRQQGKTIPMTTVDLGTAAAIEVAKGGVLKGDMGQPAYDEGVGEAWAALRGALGENNLAPFYITPPYPAIQNNVLKAYEVIWHQKPPKELLDACRSAAACAGSDANKPYLAGA